MIPYLIFYPFLSQSVSPFASHLYSQTMMLGALPRQIFGCKFLPPRWIVSSHLLWIHRRSTLPLPTSGVVAGLKIIEETPNLGPPQALKRILDQCFWEDVIWGLCLHQPRSKEIVIWFVDIYAHSSYNGNINLHYFTDDGSMTIPLYDDTIQLLNTFHPSAPKSPQSLRIFGDPIHLQTLWAGPPRGYATFLPSTRMGFCDSGTKRKACLEAIILWDMLWCLQQGQNIVWLCSFWHIIVHHTNHATVLQS